jgi:hypothetical protein
MGMCLCDWQGVCLSASALVPNYELYLDLLLKNRTCLFKRIFKLNGSIHNLS